MTAYPHLAYADAIHAALVAAGHTPGSLTATVTPSDDLAVLYTWPDGLRLSWHSVRGWRHDHLDHGGPLLISLAADPQAVADTVALLAAGRPPVPRSEQWEQARALDIAIAEWEAER